MHPTRARSRTKRLILCLALGALTSIAAAVALAVKIRNPSYQGGRGGSRLVGPGGADVPFPSNGKAPPGTMELTFGTSGDLGVTFAYASVTKFQNYTPTTPNEEPPTRASPESIAARWERSRLLPWTTGARAWPAPGKHDAVSAKAAGWPLRCLWCEVNGRTVNGAGGLVTHDYAVRGGLAADNTPKPGWYEPGPDYPIVIPLRPIVPELAANSLFYGVLWGAPVFGIPACRRSRRRRRGECERCRYDRRGLARCAPCPECGTSPAG